jgi:hypothetical protein
LFLCENTENSENTRINKGSARSHPVLTPLLSENKSLARPLLVLTLFSLKRGQ